jgi:hypothetical protein
MNKTRVIRKKFLMSSTINIVQNPYWCFGVFFLGPFYFFFKYFTIKYMNQNWSPAEWDRLLHSAKEAKNRGTWIFPGNLDQFFSWWHNYTTASDEQKRRLYVNIGSVDFFYRQEKLREIVALYQSEHKNK